MQALFKTLMNKAHAEAFKAHLENCAKTGRDPSMPYANSLDMTFAKFAELLIQECAKQCDPEPGIKYSPNAASSRQDCKEKILQLLN